MTDGAMTFGAWFETLRKPQPGERLQIVDVIGEQTREELAAVMQRQSLKLRNRVVTEIAFDKPFSRQVVDYVWDSSTRTLRDGVSRVENLFAYYTKDA